MASDQSLNMSVLPPIYILPTHLPTDDLHEIEDTLYQAAGRLTYQSSEARIFLGKVLHKKRATFDLRSKGVWTREQPLPMFEGTIKRRKLDEKRRDNREPPSESDGVANGIHHTSQRKRAADEISTDIPDLSNHIVVLKLEWLEVCLKTDEIVPFDPYLVYSGRIIEKPPDQKQPAPLDNDVTYIKAIPEPQVQLPTPSKPQDPTAKITSILERAKAEAAENSPSSQAIPFHRRRFGHKPTSPKLPSSYRPKLHRTSTSEMEHGEESKLPPPMSWMTAKHPRPMYACLRSTYPLEDNPNRYFIQQLSKIKEARLLTLDEIGVRAYSTSIASLAAYTYRITSPLEIVRLPGCNDKIASLWVDWHESVTLSDHSNASTPTVEADSEDASTSVRDAALDPQRTIPIVQDLMSDDDLAHLRTFHDIWGVGPDTARRFYFNQGWKDLDDAVQFGWSTLTRVQQIGVKFYDEFQVTIPRQEVEAIARTILRHARQCKGISKRYWTNDVVDGKNGANASCPGDPRDFVAIIVGGYRRGKTECGDVDVILTHRDETMTKDLVIDIIHSLESENWITHTLTLHTTTSDRGQQTLPYRDAGGGHGFDSLDKALCVWQDPQFTIPNSSSSSVPSQSTTPIKNPNIHRRVDIIISPWRTIGCAVLGWSGGTTFQRDIRRWVKREHGWKFDSSGVRDRGNGLVLDLESPPPPPSPPPLPRRRDDRRGENEDGDGGGGGGDGWEDRERRLMENMGIGWRPASERCTG